MKQERSRSRNNYRQGSSSGNRRTNRIGVASRQNHQDFNSNRVPQCYTYVPRHPCASRAWAQSPPRTRRCRDGYCEEDDEILQRIGADKSLSRSQILEMTQRLNHPLTYRNLWNYYTLGESDHSFLDKFSPLSTRHLSCFHGCNDNFSKGRNTFCSIQEQNEHVQNLSRGLALNCAPDSNRTLKGKEKDLVLSYCWNGY